MAVATESKPQSSVTGSPEPDPTNSCAGVGVLSYLLYHVCATQRPRPRSHLRGGLLSANPDVDEPLGVLAAHEGLDGVPRGAWRQTQVGNAGLDCSCRTVYRT